MVEGITGAGISDFGTLDPGLIQTLNDAEAAGLLYVGMIQLDDKGNTYCELCTNYSVGSDGVTWTFHLRSGLKFSDGTPLTSQDVVYSINRALDPKTMSGVGPYYLRYIKDASAFAGGSKTITTLIGDSLMAPDPLTVIIKTASPIAFFLDSLTYPTSWVVEKKVIDQWGKSWTDHLADNGGQGGAGPFKVQEYTHSKQLVVVPNPNYWGPKPQLQKIVIPIYKEADTTYQVYQTNGLDNTGVPVADIDQARTRSDYHKTPTLSIFYYTMNFNQKPFDQIPCRQAFALAVNKDLIASSVWKNTVIATNHIVPQGQPGYNANLKAPDGTTSTAGNPTKAKQLFQQCLQAEGYASASQVPPITLTYASSGVQSARNEVAALQQMWQNTLGISVKTNDIDFNKLVADESLGCSNPLQFYSGPGWIADYPDPQDWTTLQFDKGSAQNGMCYGQNKGPAAAAQQQVQQQLEAADTNQNQSARLAAYNAAEQQLVNDVAWLPVYQGVSNILRKPCVQGIVDVSLSSEPPQDWSKVFISTDTPCAKAP
jgi:peptide/nickel transport system substrate-binding protein/oligopeptide transport system substrate-binding protein